MKKRFFTMMLAFLFALPGLFLLTACGETPEPTQQKEISSLYINYNGQSSSNILITEEYGFSVSDIMSNTTFSLVYSDGTKQEINDKNFSTTELEELEQTYQVVYYMEQSNDGGVTNQWVVINGVTPTTKPDVGTYKIEFTIANHKAEVTLMVTQATLSAKTIPVVITTDSDTNWRSKLNQRQTFKYGQATHKEVYDGHQNSGYAAYAVENGTDISLTKVKRIDAIPQTLNIEDFSALIDEYQENFAAIGVQVGNNNTLECYNAIENVEGWSAEKIRQVQYEFLWYFGYEIASAEEGVNNLVASTTTLKPGDYYLFAWYEDPNYQPRYTTPYTQLKVEKGVFNLKKALNYMGKDWNEADAEEIISQISFSVEYQFSTYNPQFNTIDTQSRVVKALTAKYLNDNNAVRTNLDDLFTDPTNGVNYEICGGGYGSFTGKFKLIETKNNKEIRYDSTDNNTTAKLVYVLDNDWHYEYYEDDPTEYDATLSITKCANLTNPFAYTDTISYEYDGEEKNVLDAIYQIPENVVDILGVTKATSIGNYTVRFKLKDTVNYGYEEATGSFNYGEENDGIKTFNWSISKINFNYGDFVEKTVTYNNLPVEGDINYISGEKTFRIHLNSQRYNFLKTINNVAPTPAIVWSDQANSASTCEFTFVQDGDDVVVTITNMQDSSGYINLTFSIAATNYSNEYISENDTQVIIQKANFNDTQKAEIYGIVGAEDYTDEYQNTYPIINPSNKIIISNVEQKIPAGTVPASNATSFGVWTLTDGTNIYNNGDAISGVYNLYYTFTPNDFMYNGYNNVYVEVEYANENIPAEIITALQQEFLDKTGQSFADNGNGVYTTSAAFTIYADGTGYGAHENILPIHDNEAQGAFKGRWVLSFDYSSGDTPLEIDMELGSSASGASYSYSGDITQDYIKSTDRVWKVKFIPQNSAYNTLEILVTNVTVN